MLPPVIVSLEASTDPTLVGGKAAHLGHLLQNGFRVPPGFCLTAAVYAQALDEAGIDAAEAWKQASVEANRREVLDRMRARIRALSLPRTAVERLSHALNALAEQCAALALAKPLTWAVRSSATAEDGEHASHGGLYRTTLDVRTEHVARAIADCWSSAWTEAAYVYRARSGVTAPPMMAVIIQPLIRPAAAGVAFSQHPVTADRRKVVINAVVGLAEPFAWRTAPAQFIVSDGNIVTREDRDPASERPPTLSDDQVLEVTTLVREVEQTFGRPVDVEWALEDQLWLLQARPITGHGQLMATVDDLSEEDRRRFVWSRANFKETLPELPSPLALSFVRRFMEDNIVAQYRSLGCRIPDDVASIRVFHGRPYINVTLIQSLMAQLGGDPAQVIEQMGGEPTAGRLLPLPRLTSRLSWPRLVRALWRLQIHIVHAALTARRRFAALARVSARLTDSSLLRLTERDLLREMEAVAERLEPRDLTFAIVSGVSQALYVLSASLARRLEGWRPALNAATRGFGTIISAGQILWLEQLAEQARDDPRTAAFFITDPWEPMSFREQLQGTRFLAGFERFLKEYGHRALAESDVMSPRFAERPEYLLGIIRSHLLRDHAGWRSAERIRQEQGATRAAALATIRGAFGWRMHEWLWFRLWYVMLRHYLTLREANRHALMQYLAAARRGLLVLGGKLAARRCLELSDDIFFLTSEELRDVVTGTEGSRVTKDGPDRWKSRVAARRAERRRHEQSLAPHTIHGSAGSAPAAETGGTALYGLAVSGGVVRGRVRRILTPDTLAELQPGEILVTPVIDPGMAPVFALASGLVAEIGGLLSHGAIIAREYGLPAVVNVPGATAVLQTGESVLVDADEGKIVRLGKTLEGQSRR